LKGEKAKEIKQIIVKTDNQIDRMVNELSGMNEDDIKIVEREVVENNCVNTVDTNYLV
jgi:hypothetical protein